MGVSTYLYGPDLVLSAAAREELLHPLNLTYSEVIDVDAAPSRCERQLRRAVDGGGCPSASLPCRQRRRKPRGPCK